MLVCFRTGKKSEIEKCREHAGCELAAERNREADGAGYSADLFGGGSGLNKRRRLLQIYGVRKSPKFQN